MTGTSQAAGPVADPIADPIADPLAEAAPAAPAAGGRGRRRPAVRALRLLLGVALQLLLLVAILGGLVLGTQTGLRAALAVAESLAPGVVRVETAQGRVLGRLRLAGVQLHLPALDLTLGELDLDWSPLAAVTGTLKVQRLALRDIDAVLAPSGGAKGPLILPDLALPLGIEVADARVERLRIRERGAPGSPARALFALDRAALTASLHGSDLDLTRLALELPEPRLKAHAHGQVRLADGYPLGLDLDWTLDMDPAAALRGQGRVGGDLDRLVVEHQVAGSLRARLDLHVQDVLAHPSWDGLIQLQGVRLSDFAPGAPELETTGRLETRGDLDAATLVGTLDARAPQRPDLGGLAARVDMHWHDRALSLRVLELAESVSGARLHATGALDLKADPARVELKGDWERLRWPLHGAPLAESPAGRIGLSGTMAALDYSVSGLAQGPGLPAADLRLAGRAGPAGTRIEELLIKVLGGRLQANGDLDWAPRPRWDLKLRGQDLNPGGLVPGLDDRIALSLDTRGSPEGYDYDLAASTQGPGLPASRLTVGGKGDLRGTAVDTLRLDTLDGRIEGRARAAWDPKTTWDAELVASGLDPGVFAPDWPGRIAGRLASQGGLEPDGAHLDATVEGVEGTLRGYPIAASGQVQVAGKSLRIKELRASSGPSAARVDGTLGETLDLSFDLSSPDLASLAPQAKGSIQAQGRVGGTLKAPRVQAELAVRDAQAAGQSIASLSGSAEVALTPEGPLRIRLDGKDLVLGAIAFDTLALRGDGGMPSHRLSLALAGPRVSVRAQANGALEAGGAYRGTLTELELDHDPLGTWRLQRPMPLTLAAPRIGIGPLCLRDRPGSGGCVQFDQGEPGRWVADIDLDRIGLELIQGFLPDTLEAVGSASLKGRFEARGALLAGGAVARIPTGRIRMAMGRGRAEELDFSGSRLALDADARGLSARLGLPLKGLGEIAGDAELPGWRLDAPARPDQPLRGGVRARVDNLQRISNLVPDLTGVAGSLTADLDLGGTLSRPGVKGQAALRGFAAQVPLIGLRIADANLNAVATTLDRIDLQGQAEIGGGRFELSGAAQRGAAGLAGRLLAQGQRLKVADTKEYFALVSPRIEVDLTPAGVRIGGEILVPEARIRPRKIPAGTVSPSPDVVLAGRAGEGATPLPVDIDLRLKLGDDVTIDAFGVRGRLAGDLRVFQQPGKPMLGDGQLGIVDGIYRFSGGFGVAAEVGVPLEIVQGRLVYAKTPIDNPGLLIQAQRGGGNASAGVRVLGTIRDPKLAFFSDSDPNMTQAEITKYLLTGAPPSRDPGAADRSLSVGTYVAPKLYMEYESGIGDRKDAVKLRYDLTRRIELQTETGDNPGGDIFFKLENDWLSRKPTPAGGPR